ncbi:DEAD/DEAH box helicase [Alkalihalophilus marmarensis]|uniref:DEAD/DEAH box helicase n=1 Tax=Alkalihalophilus marmarensis TaxID=521377 RepID=UPI00203A7957|nr:DEAD/DEAH box helicase [Alkalihalophilus marmarensis]MCM3491158.1 DEAD/DEAH box helicase [Alkalihalophilus marmarensis]
MFFLRRKTKTLDMRKSLDEEMISFDLYLLDGKSEEKLTLPLEKEQISDYYKLPNFQQYMAWESLYESDLLHEGKLPYSVYYDLLKSEGEMDDNEAVNEFKLILQQLHLPVDSRPVTGELTMESMIGDASLSLELHTTDGANLNRKATGKGAVYELGKNLYLLPVKVYELKQAIKSQYEDPYQKIGICQKLAQEANLDCDSFLSRENYKVIDQYDVNVKVHSPDHIELEVNGEDEVETQFLNHSGNKASVRDGEKRTRYVKTNDVKEDIEKITSKRHITGEEVPLFFDNPYAVLPEHEYQIDLAKFSDRVKGLVEIKKLSPLVSTNGKREWFVDMDSDKEPLDEDELRKLLTDHPDKSYVKHNDEWFFIPPSVRKEIMGETATNDKSSNSYSLDIKDNQDELDYKVEVNRQAKFDEYPIPKNLHATLFPHQEEGYHWLCGLLEHNRGGLLADDMGLGKTIQVITFLLYLDKLEKLKPSLVVLPIALLQNWRAEIEKFAPDLINSVYIHNGSGRSKSSEFIKNQAITITTYDTLKIDQLLFGEVPFEAVICDEAQNVKSHSSQRSHALRAMQANFRLAMTGTPVENSLEDLWAIMDFVQPGYLGSLKDFRQTYVKTVATEQLLEKIRLHYLRRTKKEVLEGKIPKKHDDLIETVEASRKQKELSKDMVQSMTKKDTLPVLSQLRQLYGHPSAVTKEEPTQVLATLKDSPKMEKLISYLEQIKAKNEKALIFTTFRQHNFLLKQLVMEKYGIPAAIIDGATSNRQEIVDMFNRSSGFGILILSVRAAGVGLNITSANHVIHFSRWWNPAVENQATDRAYRIGQEKEVYVYQIITKDQENFPNGTVEEIMHDILQDKKELADNVIIPFDMNALKKELLEKMREKQSIND